MICTHQLIKHNRQHEEIRHQSEKQNPTKERVFYCATILLLKEQPHLVELELEAEDVAQGLVLTHVRLDQRDEELVLV